MTDNDLAEAMADVLCGGERTEELQRELEKTDGPADELIHAFSRHHQNARKKTIHEEEQLQWWFKKEDSKLFEVGVEGSTLSVSFNRGRDEEQSEAFQVLVSVQEEIADEAFAKADTRLRNHVGILMEQLRACYGWLLIYDDQSDSLVPVVFHNTRARRPLKMSDNSIVTRRVASTKSDYITGDVRSDECYLDDTGDSKSVLSVPILAADDALVGVLHFESTKSDAFTNSQLLDVRGTVVQLIPYILLLRWSGAVSGESQLWCSYPEGWSLERTLARFLYALADALGNTETPGPCLSIWGADWDKERMWVVATTGYDYEFRKEKTLSTNSFFGEVAGLQKGEVRLEPSSKLPWSEKAVRMGLKQLLSTPIYFPDDKTGCGTFNIYLADEEPLPCELAADISEMISQIVVGFHAQKKALATALLLRRVSNCQRPLKAIVKTMLECLEADECTVFVLDHEIEQLSSVLTTGVQRGEHQEEYEGGSQMFPSAPDKMTYSMVDPNDYGYTVYAAKHPRICIRKNDVPDPDEKGVPEDCPRMPTDKFREDSASSETDHRRLLVMAVEDQGEVLGVIRLLRYARSKPFKKSDEKIFAELNRHCVDVLRDQQRKLRVARFCRTQDESRGQLIRAVRHLVRPLQISLIPTKRHINELLQDLVTLFQHQAEAERVLGSEAEILACFHDLNVKWHDGPLRLYDYHSSTTQTFSRDESPAVVKGYDGCLAAQVIAQQKVFSIDSKGIDLFGNQDKWVSQIAIPVIAWGGPRLVKGLLSLTVRQSFEWTQDYVQLLHFASQRLSALLASSGDFLTKYVSITSLGKIVEEFVDLSTKELPFEWAEVHCRRAGELQQVAAMGERGVGTDRIDWVSLAAPHDESLNEYGVKVAIDNCALQVPLRLGPFEVGKLLSGPIPPNFGFEASQYIAMLCRFWSIGTLGVAQCWDSSFEPVIDRSGAVKWNEHIFCQEIVGGADCNFN